MNNNPVLWVLLVVGAAVLLGVVLFLGSGSPSGPIPERLIPDSIEGFTLVTKEAHIDPIFSDEEYSSHAFYTPTQGSPWSSTIERLGITIFKFRNASKMEEARGILLSGAKMEPLALDGQAVEFSSEKDGAGLFWKDHMLFIAIFVTAPADSKIDIEALKKAALAAGQAVLAKVPH